MFRRLAQTLISAVASPASGSASSSLLTSACGAPSSLQAATGACSWWHAAGPQQCGGQLSIMRQKYTYAFKKGASMPGLVFWTPRTPSLRHKISIDYKALGVYTGPPQPDLSFRKHNTGGRNIHGHVTVRGRGGGIKKIVRTVDFVQGPVAAGGVVERIEHDPNRSGFIALVRYESAQGGVEYRYHLAPHGMREGDVMRAGPEVPIQAGNRLQLKDIPLGVPIHNIEMVPGGGGKVARAAGVGASIKFKEEKFAVLAMPSGEVRRLPLECSAAIGSVSNPLNQLTNMGKAGVNRLRGRRPKVRGIAMNPVDHPHGGRTNGGRPSCTPWGVYCKGKRTRLRNKWTNKFIIMRKGNVPIEKFVEAKKWRVRAERERKAKSGAQAPAVNPGPPKTMLGPAAPQWGLFVAPAGRGRVSAF